MSRTQEQVVYGYIRRNGPVRTTDIMTAKGMSRIRAMAAQAGKDQGLDYQALLGHTTRAMSDHYLRARQVISAEPVRRKL